jgi:hypothetical protein
MAREPVKLNAPVSSAGQVSNRAAYMRPGRDNSGSKALADALGSLGGSLQGINQQVDRYQNAQRQSQLQAAQKAQNEEAARLQLQAIKDAEKGVSARGSYMADSPIFQAAYQESHLETSMNVRLAKEERERDWNSYSQDVDNGHNRLQADLLDMGEELMAGHSPELQAKFYSQYRQWANQKMLAQAEGARLQRLKNIGEDGTNNVMSLMATGAPLEAIMSSVEEINNLAAAGGAENPSSYGANAVMVAAELEGRTDILQALVNDKDHMKTFSSDQRKALQDKMQGLEREDRAERNYMETQQNKAFARAKGQIALNAVLQFGENPDAGPEIAKNFKGQMIQMAKEDPKNAMAYLGLADSMYNTMMPDPEAMFEGDPAAQTLAYIKAEKGLKTLAFRADLENDQVAEHLNNLLSMAHPDDRNKLMREFQSAVNDDHPELANPEWKVQEKELDVMSKQMVSAFSGVEGMGVLLETDGIGNSVFSNIALLGARAAIRERKSYPEAIRAGFARAAAETRLYERLTKEIDSYEVENYIQSVAAAQGLSDILFDNPTWERFKTQNEILAKNAEEERIKKGRILSSGNFFEDTETEE